MGSSAIDENASPAWWRTRTGIALIGFVLVGAFYLLREHYGHLLGALPYMLLLVCPVMHLFMHHGHGGHGASQKAPSAAPADKVV